MNWFRKRRDLEVLCLEKGPNFVESGTHDGSRTPVFPSLVSSSHLRLDRFCSWKPSILGSS